MVFNNCIVTGSNGVAVFNSGTLTISFSNVNAGLGAGIDGSGALICNSCTITASNTANGITSANVSGGNRINGIFVGSQNGYQAVWAARWILGTQPTNAYIQIARDGLNASSFDRFYTADNSTALNQAAPTDVRAGAAYGIGSSQTGRLTVPARGSVALSVNYGPSMPFTATRSGTTATATLAYSYPLVVGDQITVTGASNSEWNSTYTIASVVSGTEITFAVPNTHSATAGTGALLQTTGTAVLDPAAVASAVWGAASRTITGGLVDTATTLTNSPDVPTEAEIATAVWGAATKEITGGTVTNAPASVTPSDIWSHSARTLTSASGPTAAQIRQELDNNSTQLSAIKSKTDALPSDPADQSLLEAAIAGVTVPSASTVAAAVRSELSVELGRVDAAVSSRATSANIPSADISAIKSKTDNLPASPAATGDIPSANIAAIKSKTDALPASPAATGDIPSANIAAIKAKTDLLNTDRLAQVSTVSTTGAQLAAALS